MFVFYYDMYSFTRAIPPILHGFAPGLCKLQKGCTRLAAANAKAYQLLAHGRWFSQGTPASYTSNTGCHDLAEILLKNGVKQQKQLKFNRLERRFFCSFQTIISCFRHLGMKTTYLVCR